jgi:hypothetical protein
MGQTFLGRRDRDAVPARQIEHMIVAKGATMGTAQPLPAQALGNGGDGVGRGEHAQALDDPCRGAGCPGTDFEPWDLAARDGSRMPGDADIDLARNGDAIELDLCNGIALANCLCSRSVVVGACQSAGRSCARRSTACCSSGLTEKWAWRCASAYAASSACRASSFAFQRRSSSAATRR